MSGLLDVLLDVGEQVLERGVVIVIKLRQTPSGKRISLGVGTLGSSEAMLLGAAADRILRRRRRTDDDFEPGRSSHHTSRSEWPHDPMEEDL